MLDNNNKNKREFHPLAGIWSGIGDIMNGNKYTPYMTANWAGNGLARTGIGYMINPNYRDYTSAGQALAAIGSNNSLTKDNGDNRLVNNILGRLSGMGGNLGAWAQKRWNDYAVGKGNTLGDMNVRIWDNQDYDLA